MNQPDWDILKDSALLCLIKFNAKKNLIFTIEEYHQFVDLITLNLGSDVEFFCNVIDTSIYESVNNVEAVEIQVLRLY